MINRVNPCSALEPARLTVYGQHLYNHQPQARDFYFMTLQPNYKPRGWYQPGLRSYNPGPLPMINTGFGGRFAIEDLPQILQPPPWERIQK